MDTARPELPVHFEKEVHLLDYLSAIRRRWRGILLISLVIFIGVAIHTFRQVPVYEASVQLSVGAKPETSSEVLQRSRDTFFSLEKEIQVLASGEVANEAAAKLTKLWRPDRSVRNLDLQARHLTLPADLSAVVVEMTAPDSFRLLTADGRPLAEGQTGVPFKSGDATGLIEVRGGKAGQRLQLVRPDLSAARAMTASPTSARELGEQTSMLRLAVRNSDPLIARDVANAIADAYVDHNREIRTREISGMLEFIEEQLQTVNGQLNRSEQALQSFKIRTGLERLSTEGTSLVETAVELEKQRIELKLRRQRIAAYIAELQRGASDFSVVQDVPGVPDLIRQLLELRSKRTTLLRKYTGEHPLVVETDHQLRQTNDQIVEVVRAAVRGLDQQIAVIGQQLGQRTESLAQVPEDELELVRLTRDNQVNAELYSSLLQRRQESRIRLAAATSNVEIISRASAPAVPVLPDKKKNLSLGLLFALITGLGMAFLLDYLDRTIKDEDDIQEHIGLPVLGTIPMIPDGDDRRGKRLVTQWAPHTAANESFLALRTNLLYILTNQKHKMLLVTSTLPEEGKSTIACNLAFGLAQTEARVLLIDCDLRRPSQHTLLRQKETPGLTDMLIDGEMKTLRRIGTGLDFIAAGKEPPNPTKLLNSEAMRRFLAKARDRYDYVILDVPPLLPVADALILVSQVDLNIMVLESCRIPQRLAKRALTSLQSHDAAPAGIVLNDKTGRGARYYGAYSYYEGKYYQGYYRRDEPSPPVPAWRRFWEKVWGGING